MLYGFVLYQNKGFVARSGFPEPHTDLLKYARVFPLDENTVALARHTNSAIMRVGPVPDQYEGEDLPRDPRFQSTLSGRAA